MVAMTTALPNLQQISLCEIESKTHPHFKYNDGEDPDEEVLAVTENWFVHDIEVLSAFRRLSSLEIGDGAPLNGMYPFMFNFPLLKRLSIKNEGIKMDLGMLSGVPLLTELRLWWLKKLDCNIADLSILKATLEVVQIIQCDVQGDFMDLADFPCLKTLDLDSTSVTGDIREIGVGEQDFLALKSLTLPKGVYGGMGYKFQNISDAPDVAQAVYSIKKQRPSLVISEDWYAELSPGSPDWYEDADRAPLRICLVEAGPVIGYQWESNWGYRSCEVIWLDPAPDTASSLYEEYIERLIDIEEQVFFRGFFQPPTEEECDFLVPSRPIFHW